MLTTAAAHADPGVCAYRWQGGALRPLAQLSPFGAGAGATSCTINCNNQVVACGSGSGEVVLGLPEAGKAPLYAFSTGAAGQEVKAIGGRIVPRVRVCEVAPRRRGGEGRGGRALDEPNRRSFARVSLSLSLS